jgi:hypothetical protein
MLPSTILLAAGLLALGCQSSTSLPNDRDAESDGPGGDRPSLPADAPAVDGPGAFDLFVETHACSLLPAKCDAGEPPFGCPDGCHSGQVCTIVNARFGDNRGTCLPIPLNCARDGGPDAGPTCDPCAGFSLCNGAYGCIRTSMVTYVCGI